MTLPPRNAHQRTGMQKLRIVRLGSGGRSLTRPFRAARRFLSLSLSLALFPLHVRRESLGCPRSRSISARGNFGIAERR
jgi:hypothetical protein